MEYEVIKDLPWLKAGTIIWIGNDVFLRRKIDSKDGMPDSIGSDLILGATPYVATLDYFDNNLENKEWFKRI